ncbi:MAG: hypothetical protein ACK4FR_02645 [Tabrizicola sp.]
MLVDSLIDRLQERVPDFSGRVEAALSLADLMAQGRLPEVTPAAHVLSIGLVGKAVDVAAGLYRQAFDEVFGVVLTFRNNTPTARQGFERVEAIKRGVVEAVAGWVPTGQAQAFSLARGTQVSFSAGTLVYQIDFAIGDQLRIIPS